MAFDVVPIGALKAVAAARHGDPLNDDGAEREGRYKTGATQCDVL